MRPLGHGARVELAPQAVAVSAGGRRVSLSTAGRGAWQRYANGVRRTTSFGHESVVVTPQKAEQFLTVTRAQGTRTWRWKLASHGLTPRIGDDGAVGFLDGHVLSHVSIAPPKILDGAGRDVTPAGTHWTLRGGELAVRLDDARLPTPYVIDPAITLNATSSFNAGSNNGNTGATLGVPAGYRVGDLLVAQVSIRATGTTLTAPAGATTGWSLVTGSPYNNSNGGTATGEMSWYYHQVATGDPTSYTWKWAGATTYAWAGGLVDLVGVDATAGPSPAGSPSRSTTATVSDAATTIASGNVGIDAFMTASGSTASAPYWTTTATYIGSAQSGSGTSNVSTAMSYSVSAGTTIAAQSGTCKATCTAAKGIGWMTGWAIDSSAPTAASIQSPGATVRGSVTLTGQTTEADSAPTVAFEYSQHGANTWNLIAAVPATSATNTTTSWNTSALTDGFYDLRVVGRNGAWASGDGDNTASVDTASSVVTVRVDNTSPSSDPLTVAETAGAAYQYFDATSNHNYEWYNPGASGGAGSFTVTAQPTDVSNAIQLVQQASAGGVDNGNGTWRGPLTVTLAQAPNVGDVMIAAVSYEQGSTATITAPTGWTLLDTQNVSTFWGMKLYWKVATASDVASHSYVWTNTASAQANVVGGISEWANVWVPASGNPIDTEASGTSTSGTTSVTAPSVTPTADCSVLVGAFGAWSSQESFTPPAGMTELFDARSNEPQWDPGAEMTAQYLGSTSATGTRVATLVPGGTTTGGDKSNAGFLLTLRPKACVSQVDFPNFAVSNFTPGNVSPTVPDAIATYPNQPTYTSNTYSWTATNTTEPGSQPIIVHDEAGNANLSTPFYILKDTTAPSFGASTPTASGAYSALTFPVTAIAGATDAGDDATPPGSTGSGINATTYQLQRQSGTAANGVCTYSGGWTNVTLSGGNDTVAADGCYHYREAVADNVNNTGTSNASGDVIVDRVAPNSTGSVTASTSSSDTYATGSTVYYRPAGGGGSFTITDTSPTDANSGIGKVRFPGLASGITPATNTDDSSVPYSQAYSWATGASDSGSKTITVFDAAGNTATTSFTVTPDSTAPTSTTTTPTASANYRAATYPTSWSGTASDAGSGVANVKISLKDPNGNYWNGSIFTGTTETFNTATGTTSWTWTAPSLTTNGTYTVHVVSTDKVNNVEASSTFTFVYDTTAPTFSSLSLTKLGNCDANAYLNGTAVYYSPATTCASAFKVTQGTSDNASGVSSVQYPSIASGSFSHSADNVGSPFLSSAYGWTVGATYAPTAQTQTVTATDAAGNSATTTFTIQKDAAGPITAFTAPAAGAAIVNGATLTATADDGVGNAGVAQVDFRYCAGASCTFAASTDIASDTTSPYSIAWSSQPADGTYTILARSTDNVGNVTDVTRTVTIDNTAPVYASSAANVIGTQVTLAFTESGSGLDSSSTTPTSAFTVLRNGSGDAVTAISYPDSTHVTLTLTNRVFDGDTVTVAYSTTGLTTAQKVKDVAGNALATLGAQSVTTSAAASLAQSTIAASPTAITADGSSTSTITVTLKNAAGTSLTQSGGTVTMSTTLGTLGSVTNVGNGTYTATLTSSTSAGTANVTAKLDGSSLTNSVSVPFNAGAVSNSVSTVSSSPGTVAANNVATSTITVTAKDAFGNPVSGQSVSLSQGAGSSTITPASATTNGSGVATFTVKSQVAQTVTYTATVGATGILQTAQVVFTPGAATTLTVSGPASATAGVSFNTLTVTAKDQFGNVATGYTGTVHFTGGGTSPTLPANYTFTGGDNGTHTFTATLTQAGARTITATDTVTGSINGTTGTITVAPSSATTLTVTGPANATAGTSFGTLVVTAKDAYGNTATGYTGTVTFSGGGTSPTLPSNYAFV
ncbi:MAG TPA: invasin domain 3-containing protein, partial [Gaiellaceae bacterium]